MAEVGEEMCQAEIAHYANKSPEYLCSRPEKYVHIYKKALAISRPTQPQRQRAAASDTNGQRKPSATGQGARNDTPGFTCGSEGGGATSDQEDWDGPRQVSMQRSDLDLYESRSRYYFWSERTPISPRLLAMDTPEQQVADMSLWELFRLV